MDLYSLIVIFGILILVALWADRRSGRRPERKHPRRQWWDRGK